MKSSLSSTSPELQELFRLALQAKLHSYSPYSGFSVGSALRTQEGQIFTGCNVENSSFGATVCAERVAIQKAVSELGRLRIKEIMVVTDASPPWPPCGMCRQVIGEFGCHIMVYTANLKGEFESSPFADLFPKAFIPPHLTKG